MKEKERSILLSFKYSFRGLAYAIKTQKHMRFHFIAAISVLIAGIFLKISEWEFLLIMVAIIFVIVTEMLNTSLEALIDLITSKPHPLAKIAKDVAAAGVLIASFNAIVVACLVFFPKLYILFKSLFKGG